MVNPTSGDLSVTGDADFYVGGIGKVDVMRAKAKVFGPLRFTACAFIKMTGLRFHYAKIEDDALQEIDRKESDVSARLSFLRDDGWSGNIRQTFRYQDFDSARSNEFIPVTDLELGYEFPGKWGSAKLEVRNLLDRRFNWVTDRFVFQGRVPEREVVGTITLAY